MTVEFLVQLAERASRAERESLLSDPGFGQVFTDHMITIRWAEKRGWHDAKIKPYAEISLDPAAQVFHYGQEVFEGLKAYRRPDGSIAVFRPHANAERLNRSCGRMSMPGLPAETFLDALTLLVTTDHEWVPRQDGQSLYIRPFMIATQRTLGFHRPSTEYLFVMIASPSGAYFKNGIKPIAVWLAADHSRAAAGGTGDAKAGGNYAGTLVEHGVAVQNGCDQVVWLDANERRWVEEMGTSNIFFVYGSRLVTPALTGTLLAGINRDSLLTLARELGYEAEEGAIDVDRWRADSESGILTEVFASGTSAMITPVGHIKSANGGWTIGGGEPGPVTMRLRDELAGIQLGIRPDPYGWVYKVV